MTAGQLSARRSASKHFWSVSALLCVLCVLYRTPRNKTRQCRTGVVQISKVQRAALGNARRCGTLRSAWAVLDAPGRDATTLPFALTASLSCCAQRKLPFVSMAQQERALCHQPGQVGRFRPRSIDLKAGFRPTTSRREGTLIHVEALRWRMVESCSL